MDPGILHLTQSVSVSSFSQAWKKKSEQEKKAYTKQLEQYTKTKGKTMICPSALMAFSIASTHIYVLFFFPIQPRASPHPRRPGTRMMRKPRYEVLAPYHFRACAGFMGLCPHV